MTGPAPALTLLIFNMQLGFIDAATEALPMRIATLLDSGLFGDVRFLRFVEARGPADGMTPDDPETLFVPELAQQAAEREVTLQHGFGLPAELREVLASHAPAEVYLAGIGTDSTLLACAYALADAGCRPVVLSDYCASLNGSGCHQLALDVLAHGLGRRAVHRGTCLAHNPPRS